MTWPAQGPLPHPEPRKAQAVCSLGSVQPPRTPETPRGWAALVAAPGLDISPTDGLWQSQLLWLSQEVFLCGNSTQGWCSVSWRQKHGDEPQIAHQKSTCSTKRLEWHPNSDCCCPVSPFLRDLMSCSPVPPLHPHSRSRPGRGGGDTVGWGGTRVCSPPKLASRAKRKSEERKWNAHQPSNRGGFLSLRLLTKSPQLTSHSWWKTEAFPVRSGARHGHLLSPLLIHTILEVLSEQLGQKRKQKHTNWKNCAISKS